MHNITELDCINLKFSDFDNGAVFIIVFRKYTLKYLWGTMSLTYCQMIHEKNMCMCLVYR